MINNWFDYSLDEIKMGCAYDSQTNQHTCLVCGKVFEEGEIFETGGRFFDAGRAVRQHVLNEHGGMTSVLLNGDKKLTGLTDNQKELCRLILRGLTDHEIAAATGVAPATVRHTRFTLRERARQAKVFLALFELVGQSSRGRGKGSELIEIHEGARMVDERYAVTKEEEEKILKICFESLDPLRLKTFSAREKKKIVILKKITTLFEPGKEYTEKQVSETLKSVYDDFVTLRRYMIEYGFMERSADGSCYRLKYRNGTC